MKTIDDAVRELNGDAENTTLVDESDDGVLWWTGDKYIFANPGSLAAKHEPIICTRAEFDRRAAEMGYWVHWNATEDSECPVGHSTIVECEYSDGLTRNGVAKHLIWSDYGKLAITRYRVVQPDTRPEQLECYCGGEWLPCEFVAAHQGRKIYAIVIDGHTEYGSRTDDQVRTRPSERERWIEAAINAAGLGMATELGVSRIYDAGLAKMPEDT